MDNKLNIGEYIADYIANLVRTWKFVIFQCVFILLWITLNCFNSIAWDPFPFQLLKLIITIEGFFTASMLLMSNSKQASKDRRILYQDFIIDVINKREIKATRLLAQKNDKRLSDIEKKMENNGRKGT